MHYDVAFESSSNKLINAACKGQTETVAKLLTKRGKKISKRDERGDTALHKAAAMGHVEVVNMLIAKGADIGVRNYDGYTPFHLAVLCGRRRSSKVCTGLSSVSGRFLVSSVRSSQFYATVVAIAVKELTFVVLCHVLVY